MGRRWRGAAAVLCVIGLGISGCATDQDGADTPPSSGPRGSPGGADDELDAAPATVDDSPFCEHVRAFATLGEGEPSEETPEAAIAQSEDLLAVLDEIAVSVPADTPPSVEALLDDFRTIAAAVLAQSGDVDAAYAGLESDDPELWARLSDPTAHDDAFGFFAAHCGTPMP